MTKDEDNVVKISSYIHIQQSLATSLRGSVATGKRISKFVGGV